MAEKVLAHQIVSEEEQIVSRTPKDYAEHVREMIKVYVRWKQVGVHLGEIDGYQPTGLQIIQMASAVYRIADGKISEYWIQIDSLGIQSQLDCNKNIQ